MTYCIWDLDSTLCDTRHRRHLMPLKEEWAFEGAWNKYSEACKDDEPIKPVVKLYQSLLKSYKPIILSARAGLPIVYTRTRAWLYINGIYGFEMLFLKPPGLDSISPSAWKKGVVQNFIDHEFKIDLAIDDHPGTAEVFNELGIPTVVVTPPGLDFSQIPFI